MKRFIRYLYEYQDGMRVRNVGFVKAEDTGSFLSLWIYGKGFPAALNGGLEIFLFYQKEDKCVGVLLGEISGMRSMTAYPLHYEGDTSQIEGIILKGNAGGTKRWYGAVWNDRPVDIERMVTEAELELMRNEMRAPEIEEMRQIEEGAQEAEEIQQVEERAQETEENRQSEERVQEAEENRQTEERAPEPEEIQQSEERAPEAEEMRQVEERIQEKEEVTQEKVSQSPVYKITRKDIVQLPRQEWKLANNHFLMHGCRNFHHLISFEKDGKCWLGVPGIYHQQEERAAQAFGFAQFMKPEEGEILLSEEEQTAHGDFGYWCRIVNNIITSGNPS